MVIYRKLIEIEYGHLIKFMTYEVESDKDYDPKSIMDYDQRG